MIRFLRALRPLLAVPLLFLAAPGTVGASLPPDVRAIACGTWTAVPSPPAGSPNAYLEGVAAGPGNDVWAVGRRSNFSDGARYPLFRHWDRKAWRAVAGPLTRGSFNAVAALSSSDAWAVGDGPIIAHWNGRRWNIVPSPRVTPDDRQPAVLRDVAALSPNNVWAVGFNWHYATRQLIEHWNGRRWRVIPGVPGGTHPLFGITALAAKDIWAVGDGVEHWNGAKWTLQSAPVQGSAIAALSDSNVWVVNGATIEHWDGSTWRVVPTPASGEQFTTLTGITALSARDIWAVGYAGHTVPHDGYAEHPIIERWDGSAWRFVAAPATGAPDSQLLAVTATRSGVLWAVGFAGTHRAGNARALIERACASGH